MKEVFKNLDHLAYPSQLSANDNIRTQDFSEHNDYLLMSMS